MKILVNNDFRNPNLSFTWLLICLTCCLQLNLQAQTRIEIPEDSQWSRTLIEELEVVSDEQREWSAESLFATSDKSYQPNKADAKPELHNYWARLELVNTTERDQWVSFESNYWDYVTLYLRDSIGNITKVPFGVLSNSYENKFLFRPHTEYDVLINYESNGMFRRENNINLVIKPTLPTLERQTFSNYMDGITLGIMFGLALYNLFLFISLRDRSHFWYALYIFAFAFSFATLFNSTPPKWSLFFTPDYPLFAFYIKKIADPIIWISYTNFIRNFLETKDRYPVWDKAMKICISLVICQFIINMTGIYHFTGVVRSITWNLTLATCIIISILSYIQGYARAKFFLVGQFFLVSGVIIVNMYYAGVDAIAFLPHTEFFNYFRSPTSIFVCGALESIAFSFALADKYNILQKGITKVKLEKEKEKQELLTSQNEMLEQQVGERTQELQQSLSDLKTTQAQLIQAEKMASLGALTAGIAHEIQNPLNFINNFSEINIELVEETFTDGPDSETLENLQKNSEKIRHHGKRMDAIVKGMLQHSRTGPTNYEVVDINALCDEAIRMAYNGYRAKEKSFNAKYETDFALDLPKTSVIPQDLGRVILNIINNAFYAVNEKRIALNDESEGSVEYQPIIKLTTSKSSNNISITISDNGPGIPDEILDNIFQPFFTTKPTGEGTGLGLSLSYDIISKGHGGELKVRSKEGLGTEFEILLPIK